MKNIDFLPTQYTKKRAENKKAIRISVLAIGICCAVSTMTAFQMWNHSRATADLEMVELAYQAAVARSSEFTAVQTALRQSEHDAELFVYLRHPWPRSQLVRLVARYLDDSITLTRLQITQESPRQQQLETPKTRTPAELEALTPAQRDLYHLRTATDSLQTVILLEGFASDAGQLHRYVADLDEDGLIVSAELDSLSAANVPNRPDGDARFQVRLVCQRGYGQPGGPTAPPESSANDGPTALRPLSPIEPVRGTLPHTLDRQLALQAKEGTR